MRLAVNQTNEFGDRSSARKELRILETLDQDLATELIGLIDR